MELIGLNLPSEVLASLGSDEGLFVFGAKNSLVAQSWSRQGRPKVDEGIEDQEAAF